MLSKVLWLSPLEQDIDSPTPASLAELGSEFPVKFHTVCICRSFTAFKCLLVFLLHFATYYFTVFYATLVLRAVAVIANVISLIQWKTWKIVLFWEYVGCALLKCLLLNQLEVSRCPGESSYAATFWGMDIHGGHEWRKTGGFFVGSFFPVESRGKALSRV